MKKVESNVKKALTAKFVESIKPTAALQKITDMGAANLRLRVYPTGRKVWMWEGKAGGRPVSLKLGEFPAVDLSSARMLAVEVNEKRDAGEPLVPPAPAVVESEPVASTRTLDWLFDLYMAEEGNKLKTADERRQTYAREVQPTLGRRVVEDIDHDDLAKLVRTKARTAPGASNKLQALLKRMFHWAVSYGRDLTGMKHDPARDIVKFGSINTRKRYLSDYEIGVFFQAMAACPTQINPVLETILYTGVRRQEAFGAEWAEFDLDKGTWLVPDNRTKTGVELLLPLPSEVVDRLKAHKERTGQYRLVWPSERTVKREEPSPITGFSKHLKRLNELTAEIAAKDGKQMAGWTIHDLRRTLSSGMSALHDENSQPRIQPDVIERVVNHAIAGVRGIYVRHHFFAEKKAALRLWADHLETIRKAIPASSS